MPYAIQNRRTGKFVMGTDWRFHPPHQITDAHAGMMFTQRFDAEITLASRRCGDDYRVVEVKPLEVVGE